MPRFKLQSVQGGRHKATRSETPSVRLLREAGPRGQSSSSRAGVGAAEHRFPSGALTECWAWTERWQLNVMNVLNATERVLRSGSFYIMCLVCPVHFITIRKREQVQGTKAYGLGRPVGTHQGTDPSVWPRPRPFSAHYHLGSARHSCPSPVWSCG